MAVDGNWISFGEGVLTLTANGTSLTGTYQPSGSPSPLSLVGWANSTSEPCLGWTVLSAAGGNDVTSWAGQYYAAAGQLPESITTFRIQQTTTGISFPAAGAEIFLRS